MNPGRSNVGKSSLVGRLLGDKQLVRTSKTPGEGHNHEYIEWKSLQLLVTKGRKCAGASMVLILS